MLLIGGSRWSERPATRCSVSRSALPCPSPPSYRRAPLFDQTRPNYAGDLGLLANAKLVARIKASDLVIVAGARLNQTTSQDYTLFDRNRHESWCMPIPKPANLAGSFAPTCRSMPAPALSPRRSTGFRRAPSRAGAAKPRPPMPSIARSRTSPCRSRAR